MTTPDNIANAPLVVAEFGYWPSFHDAEVISFGIERAQPVQSNATVARIAIHVRAYKTVGEGTADCRQVLVKNAIVTFAFRAPSALELELVEFNHQNVVNSVVVSAAEPGASAALKVVIEPIWGFGGSFYCATAEVESIDVLPNDPA